MLLSADILNDKLVVIKSIQLIKKIVQKLDSEQGLDGMDTILQQFTHNEVMSNPVCVLDAFVFYLFCVHQVNWYANDWSQCGPVIVARPQPGLTVSRREQEVQTYLTRLVHKTDLFIQVGLQDYIFFK